MTALEKLWAASAAAPSAQDDLGSAEEMVAAAMSVLGDLSVLLASDDDKDDDSDSGDGGHEGHSTFKALVKRGMPAKRAAAMCARSDKKVQASLLCDSALLVLSGLASAEGDWVEATALDTWAVSLAGDDKGDGSKPYGDVPYADPGYQSDGKKRYPVDEKHIHAAIAYFSKAKNRSAYSAAQVKSIWGRIRSAAKKLGVEMADRTGSDSDGEKAAASMLALAAKMSDGGVPLHHGPFNGTHTHSHFQSAAHDHPHQHVNDSTHDGGPLHRPGSAPQRGYVS